VSRILVIDDDEGVRTSVARMLQTAGYAVDTVATGEEALAVAKGNTFDVILSDMRMPGISGIDVLRRLREQRVDSAFIVMTGFGTVDTAVEAMKLGAVDFVQKPFFRDELLMRVRSATDRRQLARQVTLLERQMRGNTTAALVGESEPMQRVKILIARAAAAPGTVLITGETGTGKELVARAVHTASARAGKPLVALNCAAVADSLLDTELFGHARGAFTGAATARPGLIEHANGGTLFLDEIGVMPVPLQAKLLRVLEAGELRRIGENESRQVDVRFVAATNADLQAAVDAGTFRSDLFYRLNVHRIHLPAVRERPGDVERLLDHFLQKYGPAAQVHAISEPARAALLSYDYPGNVRELEHIVQRAVAVARGPSVDVDDLPEELLALRAGDPQVQPSEGSVAAARERAEHEMIVATIARHRGELAAAARELQISRTTLWRLMKKHQIQS
jgi:DNA-binding NtrC family response regulator